MSDETDQLQDGTYRCYAANCPKTFETLEEMVAVPGKGDMSPRHFCDSCAERFRRGPPIVTDGGQAMDENESYEVVIGADGEMVQEHAELVKRQLTRDNFHEHAVEVRPVQPETDRSGGGE